MKILLLLATALILFLAAKRQEYSKTDHYKTALTISTDTTTVSGPNMATPVIIVFVRNLKGEIISKTCFIEPINATSEEFCEKIYKAIE